MDQATIRVGRCRLITEKALRKRLERKTEVTVGTQGWHRLRGRGFKQHHFYGSRLFGRVLLQDDPREQRRHFSGIQLRVDSKPSHSIYECSSADAQSACSAIRTAYAALARGKRLYDFLALLPFILLSASVDIRS